MISAAGSLDHRGHLRGQRGHRQGDERAAQGPNSIEQFWLKKPFHFDSVTCLSVRKHYILTLGIHEYAKT